MKRIILIMMILLLASCESGEPRVETFKNLDEIYLPTEKVDEDPQTDDEFEKLNNDLKKIAEELSKSANEDIMFIFNHKIFIDENGYVDGIMEVETPQDIEGNVYGNTELLTSKLVETAGQWKFTPAYKEGKPVKFRGQLDIMVVMNKEGEATVELLGFPKFDNFLHGLSAEIDEKEYLVQVDKQPSIIGGLQSLVEKIEYPEVAKRAGVEGRVFVMAYVNEEGDVTNVKLLKGIGGGCDEAALNAVRETKFTPGIMNGKPVKTQVSIPIAFKLK